MPTSHILKDLCSELVTAAEERSLKPLEVSPDGRQEAAVEFELCRNQEISLSLTIRLLNQRNRPLVTENSFYIYWPRAQELHKKLLALRDTSDLPPAVIAARQLNYPIAMLLVDRRVSKRISFAPLSAMTKKDTLGHLKAMLDLGISYVVPEFSHYCDPDVLAEKAIQDPSTSRLSMLDINIPAILAAAGHAQRFVEWRKSFERGTLRQRQLAAEPRIIEYLDSLQRLLAH